MGSRDKSQRLTKLIRRAREGNKDALIELCQDVQQIVQTYFASRYSKVMIIEELSQETHLRFLQSFPNLRDPQKFAYFVAKIALHVHQEYLIKKYSNHEHPAEYIDIIATNSQTSTQPEQHIINKIDLENALRQLPDQTKQILVMKYEGMSNKEVAGRFDLSLSAVKMIVNRGRKKMKTYYDEK
ncbi:MAG: sigma-70 family RNA polymerase sigma factor [Gammaproteobacteria bacterium]|nr:sigma-70 family RNA polymerase sigma factor [Gammaproteobacteria bacterium]